MAAAKAHHGTVPDQGADLRLPYYVKNFNVQSLQYNVQNLQHHVQNLQYNVQNLQHHIQNLQHHVQNLQQFLVYNSSLNCYTESCEYDL